MRTPLHAARALALSILAASLVQAQYVIDSLSFGHKNPISSDLRGIPGWQVSGEGHIPDILSDRVILTPPYPGNKRGALSAENPVIHPEWVADFEFRASGPERGNGNLQIWLTKEKPNAIALSSVYTIGQFDGLVLVLDQYGGRGGNIRGFLNDGTVSFKDHHNVDSLAFGHCDYAYRNLGRFSHIQLKQTSDAFEVVVDDKQCFRSNKIKLPTGYYFGISAASAENPDSFEVSKFAVSTTNAFAREDVGELRQAQERVKAQQQQQQQQPVQDNSGGQAPDALASSIKSQEERFNDLQNRLQLGDQRMNNLFRELADQKQKQEQRHTELMSKINPVYDQIGAIDRLTKKIEEIVTAIQKDVEGKDYKEHLTNLQNSLKDTQNSLMNHLPAHMSEIVSTSRPRLGLFLFVVIAFQIMLLGSYLVYRRRRDNAPKKYL